MSEAVVHFFSRWLPGSMAVVAVWLAGIESLLLSPDLCVLFCQLSCCIK